MAHTAASYAVIAAALAPTFYGIRTDTLFSPAHPQASALSMVEAAVDPAPAPTPTPEPAVGPAVEAVLPVPDPPLPPPPKMLPEPEPQTALTPESDPAAAPVAENPGAAVQQATEPEAEPAANAAEERSSAPPAPAPAPEPIPEPPPSPPPPSVIPDSPAVAVERVQPRNYPLNSWRQGREGSTVVLGMADVDGHVVDNPTVAVSSGALDLDAAALAAFRQWRFQPAIKHGQPAAGLVQGEFVFRLK